MTTFVSRFQKSTNFCCKSILFRGNKDFWGNQDFFVCSCSFPILNVSFSENRECHLSSNFLGPMANKNRSSITDVSEEVIAAQLWRKNAERQRRYREHKRQAETEEEAVAHKRLMTKRQQKYRENLNESKYNCILTW